MKFKVNYIVNSMIDPRPLLRIDVTKTTWEDIPYQDENGEWQNTNKMFNLVLFISKDPAMLAESLENVLNGLVNVMDKVE